MGIACTTFLELRHADLGYNRNVILQDVNLSVSSAEIVTLLGPNGAGKTTLFKTIMGFIRPVAGSIAVRGTDIREIPPRELGKLVAYVPQLHKTPFPFKVRDVVLFGRTVHLGLFSSPGKEDRKVADRCLDLLDAAHLAERPFTELSGGERQMVILARALAQEASFIILDEPTANLDYGNQVRVIRKIKELQEQSIGIMLSTHQPDHAFMLGATVLVMKNGSVFQPGKPEDVLTSGMLRTIYGVDVDVIDMPPIGTAGRKLCAPVV